MCMILGKHGWLYKKREAIKDKNCSDHRRPRSSRRSFAVFSRHVFPEYLALLGKFSLLHQAFLIIDKET